MPDAPASTDTPRTFAYYCSGHGFGHATRVTALALHLVSRSHTVKVATNAPAHVFASLIAHPSGRGSYRHADVDAGVVQPKAYDVDRAATVAGLQRFLDSREAKIEAEVRWLRDGQVDCVLVDATFLPCAAAQRAGIPAVIISNFTFCSCYSYLSAPSPSAPPTASGLLSPDRDTSDHSEPIPDSVLAPLVAQAISDYACADLLLRLPGGIPIPAFDTDVQLPSTQWVDREKHSFTESIQALLSRDPSSIPCNSPHPLTLSANPSDAALTASRKRRVVDVPLIVRPTTTGAYGLDFREKSLASVGVPPHLRGPETKVLLVSFGGQSIPRPKSRPSSPVASSPIERPYPPPRRAVGDRPPAGPPTDAPAGELEGPPPIRLSAPALDDAAPPASAAPGLLPPGWIAIVTGLAPPSEDPSEPQPAAPSASGSSTPLPPRAADLPHDAGPGNALRSILPPHFYASRKDVYVPDLTAVADVVLGKLGYGTCSEVLATRTPFVYVPRPLFVEEFGLKRLMEQRGVSVPMPRDKFEAGAWDELVLEACERGGAAKAAWRRQVEDAEARLGGVKEAEDAVQAVAAELDRFLRE